MRVRFSLISAVLMICCTFVEPTYAQRAGANVSVQYGTVSGRKQVDLSSGAIPGGALVGGSLGLLSASGKSSGKKARNAVVGVAAGATVAGAAQGSTAGMLYDIDLGPNGKIQVVSDQREIQQGDCVAVEKAGDTANVRRVTAEYCDGKNKAAVEAVATSAASDAKECLEAKQQLVDATTSDVVELASKKIALLCND